jgi:hypothetical protein
MDAQSPTTNRNALSGPAARHVPDGVVLALACVAQFMVVLDVSIVNVAALTGGYGRAFVVAAGLGAVACLCALIVPRTNRRPAAPETVMGASPARQAAPTPGAVDV